MARPIDQASVGESFSIMLLSIVLLIVAILFVFACTCCGWDKSKPRFERFVVRGFDNSRLNVTPMCSRPHTLVSTATTGSRRNTANTFSPASRFVAPPSGDIIEFEALPQLAQLLAMADASGRLTGDNNNGGMKRAPLPALYNTCVSSGISAKDWFDDPLSCFARKNLIYEHQLGTGWFGKVIGGEARGIVSETESTKVVVEQLHAASSLAEQMYFLHEMSAWRDSNHPHVLRLLGRCLEADPYLLILENFGT